MRSGSITTDGWRRLFLTATLLWLCGYGSAQGSNSPLTATVAAGADRGYYWNVCQAMMKVASQENFQITCLLTQGSLGNVYDLERGNADFAFVQSDVAHRAWMAEPPFEWPHPQIQIVAPLFTEKVHILVRPHQYLTSVAQLKGKKIWMGEANSGSRVSASAVLQAAGLPADPPSAVISLDSQMAFALLGKNLPNEPMLLDAIIDSETPSPEALNGLLLSLGIKTMPLDLPQGAGTITLLFRPDMTIHSFADLPEKKVWAGEGCCSDRAAVLAALGLTKTTSEEVEVTEDVATSLEKLKNHQIDAIIQPKQFSPAMVQAILKLHGFGTFPFASDPRTNGKSKLVAFLRPGLTISASRELADACKTIWWPQGNQPLDEAVLQTLLAGNTPGAKDRKTLMERDISYKMALELLVLGDLDAVFDTTVATSPTISALMDKTEIGLLGIDRPLVEKLVDDSASSKNDSYVETSFQHSTYPALSQGIYTVGVQTFLLAGPGKQGAQTQSARVAAMARLLRYQQSEIQEAIFGSPEVVRTCPAPSSHASGGKTPKAPFRLTLLGSPLKHQVYDPNHGIDHVHPMALGFLVKPGHLRRGTLQHVLVLVSVTLVLTGAALLLERKQRLSARYRAGILFVVACLFLWGLAAIWLQTVEGDVTQEFSTVNEAASSFGKNVLSQLHLPVTAPEPSTPSGQQVLEVFSWLGALLIGSIFLPFLKQIWVGEFLSRLLGSSASDDTSVSDGTDPMGD